MVCEASKSATPSCPFFDSWPRAWMSMPEPDWLCSPSCEVVFLFDASAFEVAEFDWSTEPSLPGLQTRTGLSELPLELQPHSDFFPKSWIVLEPATAACPFSAF